MVFRAGQTAATRFPAAQETARVIIVLHPGCLRRLFARVSGDACLIAGPQAGSDVSQQPAEGQQ